MQYRHGNCGNRRDHHQPLNQLGPLGRRCFGGPQPHLLIKVGRAEEGGSTHLLAVGGDSRADAGGAGDDHITAVFDRPQRGERQLLLTHGLVEGRVIGGHRQHLGAISNRFAQCTVENDLPAGCHSDRYTGGVDNPGTAAGNKVTGSLGVGGQSGEERAPGQVFPERLDYLLIVALARTGGGVPYDHGVGGRRIFHRRFRTGDDRADQDRNPDGPRSNVDLLGGVEISQRVDIRGILRPDHESRLRSFTGPHVLGELEGLPDMVVQDGAALGIEVQPQPRDIALDRGDRDRWFVSHRCGRAAYTRCGEGGGQQHNADTCAG